MEERNVLRCEHGTAATSAQNNHSMNTALAFHHTQQLGAKIMQQLLHRRHGFTIGRWDAVHDGFTGSLQMHLIGTQQCRSCRRCTSPDQTKHAMSVAHIHDGPGSIHHVLACLQSNIGHSRRLCQISGRPVQLLHCSVKLILFAEEATVDSSLQSVADPKAQPGSQQQNEEQRQLLSGRRVQWQTVGMRKHASDGKKRRKAAGYQDRHNDVASTAIFCFFSQHQPVSKNSVRVRGHK